MIVINQLVIQCIKSKKTISSKTEFILYKTNEIQVKQKNTIPYNKPPINQIKRKFFNK